MSPRLDAVSASAVRTKCMFGETLLATGTGFFYRAETEDWFVTARHNVTGRHSETGELLDKRGGIPNRLVITTVVPADGQDRLARQLVIRGQERVLALDDFGSGDAPLRLLGHTKGPEIDLACIGPFSLDATLFTRPVNDPLFDLTPLQVNAGDDAFVLGYPHFVDGGASFIPVWKRASVASSPQAAEIPGRLPRVLVDTATRQGMSGAPVFVRQSGLVSPRGIDGSDGDPLNSVFDRSIIGTCQDFLGCYSGRLGESDPLDSQLGVVWTQGAINEVITNGVALDVDT